MDQRSSENSVFSIPSAYETVKKLLQSKNRQIQELQQQLEAKTDPTAPEGILHDIDTSQDELNESMSSLVLSPPSGVKQGPEKEKRKGLKTGSRKSTGTRQLRVKRPSSFGLVISSSLQTPAITKIGDLELSPQSSVYISECQAMLAMEATTSIRQNYMADQTSIDPRMV